jgi:hypothetical protein
MLEQNAERNQHGCTHENVVSKESFYGYNHKNFSLGTF